MITYQFKTVNGEVNTRSFNTNEGISLFGSVYDFFGLPDINATVQVDITDKFNSSIFSGVAHTNFWGDYNFYFITPGLDQKLNVKITGVPSIGQTETKIIPISVGNVSPDPLPTPSSFSLYDLLPVILIAGVGYGIYKIVK
jgi:hypothetical protein